MGQAAARRRDRPGGLALTDPDAAGGRLVFGRYRIRGLLGRGGMGTVWAAHDEVLHRDVALKEVQPSPELTPEQRAEVRLRSLREARAAARLTHPAAVTIYDVIEEDDGRPWIVMELLPHRTLGDVLAAEGPLTAAATARLGLDLLGALESAHRVGVLHRDVKPANVLIAADGHAVLTDFGIATLEGDPTLTAHGLLLGSPGYMSPERARGERPTPASDLWSLGATLYAAVEGEPPFRREGQLATLHAVLTEEPPSPVHAGALGAVIAGLLERDPARRLSADQAREGLQDAAEALARAGVVARDVADPGGAPSPPAAPGSHSPTRRQALVGAAVLAAVLVVAVVAAVWPSSGPGRSHAGGTPAASTAGSTASRSTAAGGSSAPGSGASATGAPAPGSSDASAGTSVSPSGAATSSGQAADVPAGFRPYLDASGFTVAVPAGWRSSTSGLSTFFRDPAGRSFLQIDRTDRPKPDPLADWQAAEAGASAKFPGYRRIRLERVDYRGWNAVDWEFTWNASGGPLHVVNRNIRVNDRQAYALYWSVPATEWSQRLATFGVVAQTFRPAP